MKKIIIALQLSAVIVITCVILFTSIPKTTGVIIFAALMVMLFIIGFSFGSNDRGLKNKISELLKELNVASSRIGSVSQEISISIGESNLSSNALFDETREMRDLTASVNDSLSDMITQLKSMIASTEAARDTAATMEHTSQLSSQSIQNGMAEIMHIVNTMGDIKVTSNRASDSIEKLSAASNAVRSIIEKINDISKQMHIIAINASVEAQRAGRYGASFAVVAREFQSLSTITDTSMREIGGLIDDIQKDISAVYSAVKDNSSRVDEGVGYSKVVEDSLTAIDASFGEVTGMVSRITGIAAEQTRLADDMGARVDYVESLIQKTNNSVHRVVQSAQDQKRSIENISEMGEKLGSASSELLSIGGGAAAETEHLDDKTRLICKGFFPIINEALCQNRDLMTNERGHHYELLSRFKSAQSMMEAVWTNELNGRFICSIPKAGIANAAMRDWFKAAIEGERYISSIYISGITKNRCVTLSMPYYDDAGEMRGIIGVDLNLDLLKKEHK